MVILEGVGHFDVYFEPTLSKAAEEAISWFKKYV